MENLRDKIGIATEKFRNSLEPGEKRSCLGCHFAIGAGDYGASNDTVARRCKRFVVVNKHIIRRRSSFKLKRVAGVPCMLNEFF